MEEKENIVYKAKLAEQAERYEDMVQDMKQIAEDMGKEEQGLSTEERNLLSVAYKNVIGARRASWRVLSSLEKNNPDPQKAKIIKDYREKVEQELRDICNEILGLLDNHLIKYAKKAEEKVFYNKMKGDYWRYQAEFLDSKSDACEAAKVASLEAYKEADGLADKELDATDPIRLGLALNFSVFHYEIMGKPDKACQVAKEAFDKAIADPSKLSEEKCKDSTLIMQLLRDNLTLWTSDAEEMEVQDVEDKDS
ncbi:uncharacterized protein [Montipora capricornis]|uniref:uncharacterized protein isoform X2 n=1 Tax=Montipora foliosa TaxID=591990 RepID=UPI0035F1FDC2